MQGVWNTLSRTHVHVFAPTLVQVQIVNDFAHLQFCTQISARNHRQTPTPTRA